MSNKNKNPQIKPRTLAPGEKLTEGQLPEDSQIVSEESIEAPTPLDPQTNEAVERIIGEKIPDSIICRATGGRCVPVFEITELDGVKRLACKLCAGEGKDRKAIRSL